jgi:predicted AAA+ superfamily ATPase
MPNTIKRLITPSLELKNRSVKSSPMLFVTGPRQVGKTFQVSKLCSAYYNWDTIEVKKAYLKDPYFFRSTPEWLVFDEIHKRKDWKKLIKGYYDSPSRSENFIVTGSGRFNLHQKGGDSLQGRYNLFHMYPITFDEFEGRSEVTRDREFSSWEPDNTKSEDSTLIQFGGFPAPLIAQNTRNLTKWKDLYIQRLVNEETRDFSKVELLDKLELLARLLPERVKSPISIAALSEDLDCSRDAIKTWLRLFDILYFGFFLPPFSRKIHRAVKKERKFYFYQWTFCQDEGALFENYIAVQLYTACRYWRDQGLGIYDLCYLRDQDDREVDFLIVKDLKPLALIEAKSSPQPWTKGLHYYTQKLKVPGFLVYPKGPTRRHENGYSLSSAAFLKELVGTKDV